jgi:hypothetical protein
MAKRVDYTRLHAFTPYSGKLASTGDAELDAMWLAPHVRVLKEKLVEPTECPGCGVVAVLTKGHYATLCIACHADIKERAARPI